MSDILTAEWIAELNGIVKGHSKEEYGTVADSITFDDLLAVLASHEALRATVARLEQENESLRDGWHAFLHCTNMPRDPQPSSAQEPE